MIIEDSSLPKDCTREAYLTKAFGIELAKPKRTTGEIRGSPGSAWGTKNLSKLSPSNWKKAIEGNGASIPMSVGKKLSGRN